MISSNAHLLPTDSVGYLGIDPGTYMSGVAILDSQGDPVRENLTDSRCFLHAKNEDVGEIIRQCPKDTRIVIEMVGHYGTGMSPGKSVYLTCLWIGRFIQIALERGMKEPELVTRVPVRLHFCGTSNAKKKNIRTVMSDYYVQRLGAGGGKTPAKGIKADPGPLYGISEHSWSGLSVSLYQYQKDRQPRDDGGL